MKKVKMIPEDKLKKIKKILIIQYKPFGDILLNTGYMPSLRKKFPDAEIDYLIQKPYKTLLEDNPNLDNLILMEKKNHRTLDYYIERLKVIRKVRKLKYDMIIDQIRGPGSAQITLFSGAKYRLGWKRKNLLHFFESYNWVYNYLAVRDDHIYYSRAKFEMLKPLGINEVPHNTFYHIKEKSKEYINDWLRENDLKKCKKIVISPVTPVLRKQWSFEYFAKVTDMIIEKTDYKVIMLWGPGEKEKVDNMISMMKNKPIYAPKTSFNEAGALLKESDIYFGNDGGINHLAVAMETPSLAIFGPKTDPLKWQAWHKPQHMYLRNYECDDYWDRTLKISPEMAFDKLLELIKVTEDLKKNV